MGTAFVTVLLLVFLCASVQAQSIFINQVPEYSQLQACALGPVSQIVRDMVSGCGDGGRTTSYDCFCVSSSTKFESIISKAVATKCMPTTTDGAPSALAVFDSYCHLGGPLVSVPTPTSVLSSQVSSPPNTTIVAIGIPIQTTDAVSTESIQSSSRLLPTPTRPQLAPIQSDSVAVPTRNLSGYMWLPVWTGVVYFMLFY